MTRFNNAFWRWFGDSKVVDENGEPLVVYHGTDEEEPIRVFAGGHGGPGWDTGLAWFAEDLEGAMAYGDNIIPVYLSIQNPALLDGRDGHLWKEAVRYNEDDPYQLFRKKGFDGLKTSEAGGSWLVFSPTQIKSIYNRGTWDPTDLDIRRNPPWWELGDTVTLYHGTSSALLPQIERVGLVSQEVEDLYWALLDKYVPPERRTREGMAKFHRRMQTDSQYRKYEKRGGPRVYLSTHPAHAARYADSHYAWGGELLRLALSTIQDAFGLEYGPPFPDAYPVVLKLEVPVDMARPAGHRSFREVFENTVKWAEFRGQPPPSRREYQRHQMEVISDPIGPEYIVSVHPIPPSPPIGSEPEEFYDWERAVHAAIQ